MIVESRDLTKAGAKDVTYMRIDDAGHAVFSQFGNKTPTRDAGVL